MKKQSILILISLSILAGLIYFSNIEKVIAILLTTNLYFISIALFLWFLSLLARTERWRYLLLKVGVNVPFFQAVKVFIPSMFISNLTPAKVGEPIRSVLLKKSYGKSIGKSLPTIFHRKNI